MSALLRSSLEARARRHRWDADALYALVSLSTEQTFALDAGVARWTPEHTAVGLLQWSETAARRRGVERSPHPPSAALAVHGGRWATWAIASMGLEDQVALVERTLELAFSSRAPKRPVDYYLAAWGAAPGLPASTVISLAGEQKFQPKLDINGDEKIEVGDLERAMRTELDRVKGSSAQPLFDVCWSLFLFLVVRKVRS